MYEEVRKITENTEHELIRKYNTAVEYAEWGVGLSFDLRIDTHILPLVTKELHDIGGEYSVIYNEQDCYMMFMDIEFPNSPYLQSCRIL